MEKIICGIDEAGRGPLAGPVTAAAVVLPENFPFDILDDSKKLNPGKRLTIMNIIKNLAIDWSIGWASHMEIDELNVLNATFLAMERAFDKIKTRVDIIIIDGNRKPLFDPRCKAVIRADASIPEVMAASILAKTARDELMQQMDAIYPDYGYAKHKGYPTREHLNACLKLGTSPIQRITFKIKSWKM